MEGTLSVNTKREIADAVAASSDAPAVARGPRPSSRFGRNRAALLIRGWWQFAALALFILVVPTTMAQSPYFNFFTLAGIWGIAAVGVSLLASLGGQYTFGQAGVVSVGAYSTAILTGTHGWHPLLALLVGVVVAAAVALVTAPILRLRGWYLALATLALGYLFQHLEVNLKSLTGGNNGLFGFRTLSFLGVDIRGKTTFFVTSWLLVLAFMLIGRNLSTSRFGRAAGAIQADETAARSLAIPALRYKVVVYVLAAVMASVAGTMYAHYSQFISPEDFGIHQSMVLFTAVLLGGQRSMFGVLVALTFLVSLPELGRGIATTQLLTAISLMTVYAISPHGLAGLGKAAIRRLGGGRRGA